MILFKQPNGKYLIFDEMAGKPKKWNITKKEYIKECIDKAKRQAMLDMVEASNDITMLCEDFIEDDNISGDRFDEILKEIGCNRLREDILGWWED